MQPASNHHPTRRRPDAPKRCGVVCGGAPGTVEVGVPCLSTRWPSTKLVPARTRATKCGVLTPTPAGSSCLDEPERHSRPQVRRLRQCRKNIGLLVEPATLFPGSGKTSRTAFRNRSVPSPIARTGARRSFLGAIRKTRACRDRISVGCRRRERRACARKRVALNVLCR